MIRPGTDNIFSDVDKPSRSGRVYTVTEITRAVKTKLEDSFPFILVEGEISNFKQHSSGHLYFSLKDSEAQIDCVFWRGRNQRLLFRPQDGMQVLVNGEITVYERQGRYQLSVLDMHVAGEGSLHLAFEELKRRLEEEGLFDSRHKKPIPMFPEKIGVITSDSGAAIRDIVSVISRRFPAVELVLRPVPVQGETAAVEICQALEEINEYGQVEVIILGRGGGSLEDLWSFNEEILARAIFKSRIPVVSAVGHEVDFTISDFVADLRAPTPSAAAELVVPERLELEAVLRGRRERLSEVVAEKIDSSRSSLEMIKRSYGLRRPYDYINEQRQRLDESQRSLELLARHTVTRTQTLLEGVGKSLQALNPAGVLHRGYSITARESDGTVITDAGELRKDEIIDTTFARGRVLSRITSHSAEKDERIQFHYGKEDGTEK